MPDWHAYIRNRLSSVSAEVDDAIVAEWAQHADASFAAARADGATAADADAQVRALVEEWCTHFNGLGPRRAYTPLVEPPHAEAHGWTGLAQDLRYGLRLLTRQPGFALVASLLIAIGVGATTTLSSLTYAVLLKPLPFPDADRLIRVAEHREGETHTVPNVLTNGTYLSWTNAPTTIEALAAWNMGTQTITVRGDARRVRVASATASLFAVVPTRPLAGRFFSADEEHDGANHVVVLGDGLAERYFGSSQAAIDQHVDLDGTSFLVVGVADRNHTFPAGDVEAWIPMGVPPVVQPGGGNGRSVSMMSGVARLKAGVTPEQATTEGTARAKAAPDLGLVGMAVFGTQNKPTVSSAPYLDALTSDIRPALFVIVVAVGLLFVVAIANVAGMQLARTTARRREVAIRSALGASPARLARQLLTENLAVGALGGLAGWLLSLALHRLLPTLLPTTFPRLEGFRADWRVTVFAVAAAGLASVAFGALPALIARRLNLVEALVEDSQAPAGGGSRTRIGRMRTVILAGQVAIAALLLTGASLFGRSFLALLTVDRGYDPRNLATVTLPMPDRTFTGLRRGQVLDAIVERVAHAPGVIAAAASSVMPLLPYDQMMGFQLPPGPGRREPQVARAQARLVSPAYFQAMGMRVLRGRGFTDTDSPTSGNVVLVNETFARRYLPDNPIGANVPITYIPNSAAGQTVIGIVDDVKQHGATDPPQPEIFFDYRQLSIGMMLPTPVVIARTSGDPTTVLPLIARYAQEASPGLVADSAVTMDERLVTSLAQPRLYALVFATFAGFALLVAGTGLFGVLSYAVTQRSREIGVRAALGARPADIVRLVVSQAAGVTLVGAAVGLGSAFLLVTLVGTLLYGVSAHDAATFAVVPVVVFVIAAVASIGPARRAARIDPLTTLKKT